MRRVGPNQWVAAAKGLGFHIHIVCFKDEEFKCVLKHSDPSPYSFSWEHCWEHNRHPDLAVVFLDRASLSTRVDVYWHSWITPHVFFSEPDTVILAL